MDRDRGGDEPIQMEIEIKLLKEMDTETNNPGGDTDTN